MKIMEQNLREHYESLATNALIELYTKHELSELASSVLVQILKERDIPQETLRDIFFEKKLKKAGNTLKCMELSQNMLETN